MAQPVIVIDATVGGASTNSYLSLAEAEVFIHQRPFHDAWDKITDDDEKKAALLKATSLLSHMSWKGLISTQEQAQAFPRSGLYDYDGRLYADDAYPSWLKGACSEITFNLATDDRISDTGTEGFSKIKVASIEVEIDKYDRPAIVPDHVMSIIRNWLDLAPKHNASVVRV